LDEKVRIFRRLLGCFISELVLGSGHEVESKNEREKWDEFLHGYGVGGIVSVGAQKATVGSSHGRKEAHFVLSSFGFFLTISLTNPSASAI